MGKSRAQSQVDSATKAKWTLEGKIIEGRITSQSRKGEKRCSMFDEEIELEGREDYEADYEEVLDGLKYPTDYSNCDRTDPRIHPAIRGIMLPNPMSRQEFSFSGSHLLSSTSSQRERERVSAQDVDALKEFIVSESPEPTSPPKEEEDEEGFQAWLRRRCDRDETLSPFNYNVLPPLPPPAVHPPFADQDDIVECVEDTAPLTT